MTTPGPKPKPAEVAEKQGNPGHRPLVRGPELPPADPNAPDWLADDALAIWRLLQPRVRTMGYFKDSDRMSLARLCDHWARWLRLRTKVDARGESYETESKHGRMQRINPDFAAMLRVEERMQQLEDRFGLTPAARQQLLSRLQPSDLSMGLPTVEKTAPNAVAAEAVGGKQSPLGMFAPRPNAAAGKPN